MEFNVELTILMPCLNEVETLAVCIEKAHLFIKQNNIDAEVVIADNGSTDGSIEVAESLGARVVHVPIRGYGAALQRGIEEAKGEYVIMGDSDDSYDFSDLMPYVEQLRAGYDLVMGNRFKGGIAKGAMPFLHKYLGNPVLSFLGRLFFKIPVGDFHCGLRGFRRDTALSLGLTTPGMEYASELVVRMALAGGTIKEVPTTLSPDGRSRPPHLNTWQDGWRHLRFLLMFSPRWLFFYPSLFILVFGLLLAVLLAPGAVSITPNITLDIHSMIVGCFCVLVGIQGVSFSIVARRYAALRGFLPFTSQVRYLVETITLERVLIVAALFFLGGLGGFFYCISNWFSVHLGALEYGSLVRVLMLSGTSVAIAVQLAFTSFLAEILEIKSNNPYEKNS
ncbi:MAG: glycosyltransferase family 2 protein [Methyloprofundus sp.]